MVKKINTNSDLTDHCFNKDNKIDFNSTMTVANGKNPLACIKYKALVILIHKDNALIS